MKQSNASVHVESFFGNLRVRTWLSRPCWINIIMIVISNYPLNYYFCFRIIYLGKSICKTCPSPFDLWSISEIKTFAISMNQWNHDWWMESPMKIILFQCNLSLTSICEDLPRNFDLWSPLQIILCL